MSRRDQARLLDILRAIETIDAYMARGGLADGMVYDAVRIRLVEMGEAVKGLSDEILVRAPDVPWREIARMRDQLAHRYFDTDHAIVADVVDNDLAALAEAVRSFLDPPG